MELLDEETLGKLKQDIKEDVENIEDTEKLAALMWKFVLLWLLTNDTEKQRAGCGCEPIINPGGDVPITLFDNQTQDVSDTYKLNSSEKPNSCDHIAEVGKKEPFPQAHENGVKIPVISMEDVPKLAKESD